MPTAHTLQGDDMPHPKRSASHYNQPLSPGSVLGLLAERTQLDFELDFYGKLLATVPDFADVLAADKRAT